MAESMAKLLECVESSIECAICLDVLKIPKALPCLHSFCLSCLENTVESPESEIIICPTCREEHKLPDDGVKGFRDNHTLNYLKDQIPNQENSSGPDIKSPSPEPSAPPMPVYSEIPPNTESEFMPSNPTAPPMEMLQISQSPTPSELDINTGEEKHSENKNSTTTPQFSCPNLKMGCKWEGSQEEEHLKKHCQFEQGNCSHCEKRFLRKDLETHEMLVCIERPAACSKNCGWIGRKAGLNGHLENCPGPDIACSQKCCWIGKEKDLKQHLDTCPGPDLSCENQKYGCTWMGKKSSIKNHLEGDCQYFPCNLKMNGCPWNGKMTSTSDHFVSQCEYHLCFKNSFGCTWIGKQSLLKNHFEIECQGHKCQNSGCNFDGKKKEVEDHQEKNCLYVSYQKCHACKELVLKTDIDEHIGSKCAYLNVSEKCNYCETKVVRKNINKHTHGIFGKKGTCLQMAVKNGETEYIQKILLSVIDLDPKTNLPKYFGVADISEVLKILSKVNLPETYKNGLRAIISNEMVHVIDSKNNVKEKKDVIENILSLGASPDIQDKYGNTPLHIAALKGQIELSKVLLSHGASPDIQDKDGNTPLHIAALKGQIELLKLFLSHRASPDIQNNHGYTPLLITVRKGQIDVIENILSLGASPDIQDKDGNTPLHIAALKGQIELSKLLLSHGASPYIQDKDGNTPLHIAAIKGQIEMQLFLLKQL